MYWSSPACFGDLTILQDVTGILQQSLRIYGIVFSIIIMLTGDADIHVPH